MKSSSPAQRRSRGGTRGRAQSLTDSALVLRRFPFGESSLMVHLLTPGQGKVVALAKGAYRPKSGYCGVLDLFDELEVTWRPSVRSAVAVLQGAEIKIRRRGICAALDRYQVACTCLEIAGIGSRESQADPALFAQLSSALQALHGARIAPRLVSIAFDLGFLRCTGLEPALEHCCTCGKNLAAERRRTVPFSPALGGRLCDTCRVDAVKQGRRVEELPRPVLRVARSLMEAPLDGLARIHLDADLAGDLERFVHGFVEYHLETRLRARASTSLPPRRSGR